jgi:HAD superfamily hydrolase (TIGR01549 family)
MILFDLDDTIFDHKHSRLCGLTAIQELVYQLKSVPLLALEVEHDKQLLANYNSTLTGQMSVADARMERIKKMLSTLGIKTSNSLLSQADTAYRTAYEESRRAIPGVVQLLYKLKEETRLGLVTNGLSDLQHEKIDICNVRNLLEFIFISDEIGHKKPEKEFFEYVFSQTGSIPSKTILVGDTWDSDILGGHRVGMHTIWLNRYNMECPDPSTTTEIQGYEPVDKALDIFREVRNRRK